MNAPVRLRLLRLTDRTLTALLVAAVAGTGLAFGGAVWWARPALAALIVLAVLVLLVRGLLLGAWCAFRSPITPLAVLALLLAMGQLAPLPAQLAARLSPRAHAAHALGVLPDRARADDPAVELPEPGGVRSPATLDRSATLRWLVGAVGLLALFCTAAHFADRLKHTVILWGCVVGVFALNTVFAVVQVVSGAGGLYGHLAPGDGVAWAPGLADVLATPGSTVLRIASEPGRSGVGWAIPRPEPPFLIGSLMGGPGAYLALGALALPLGLGLLLQALAPRGSRESLASRLRHSGRAGLVAFLGVILLAGAAMTGMLAGRLLCIPAAIGLVLAGALPAGSTGLRWLGLGLTAAFLAALAAGVSLGESLGRPPGGSELVERPSLDVLRRNWAESAQIARDFPLTGAGMGSYPTVHAYYKSQDATARTAGSSLLQWAVEAGLPGLALLGLSGLWALVRLPLVLRRVGTADRALAWALIGAMAAFVILSAIHWTVELTAVAVAACAVAGTLHRWLAGGTDLFVQPA